MKGRGRIFKLAVLGGIVAYILVGIVVMESVETVKIGYQIAALNKEWQQENFRFAGLLKRYKKFTNFPEVLEKARAAGMRFPNTGEIIFLEKDDDKKQ